MLNGLQEIFFAELGADPLVRGNEKLFEFFFRKRSFLGIPDRNDKTGVFLRRLLKAANYLAASQKLRDVFEFVCPNEVIANLGSINAARDGGIICFEIALDVTKITAIMFGDANRLDFLKTLKIKCYFHNSIIFQNWKTTPKSLKGVCSNTPLYQKWGCRSCRRGLKTSVKMLKIFEDFYSFLYLVRFKIFH